MVGLLVVTMLQAMLNVRMAAIRQPVLVLEMFCLRLKRPHKYKHKLKRPPHPVCNLRNQALAPGLMALKKERKPAQHPLVKPQKLPL